MNNLRIFGGWRSDDRGQALLEFALVMPILLFLLFAIFTVGWWMNTQQILTQAVRIGARQGALTNDNAQIQGAIAQGIISIDPDASRTTVGIVPPEQTDSARRRGNPLTVSLTYTMPFTFDELPAVFRTVNTRTTVLMECEPPSGEYVCQ